MVFQIGIYEVRGVARERRLKWLDAVPVAQLNLKQTIVPNMGLLKQISGDFC